MGVVAAISLLVTVIAFIGAAGMYRRWLVERANIRRRETLLWDACGASAGEAVETVIALIHELRRRDEALNAIISAAERLADGEQQLIDAQRARDGVGGAAQDAVRATLGEQATASEQVGNLTVGVVQAGAAVEETITSIGTVSSNITGLADNVSTVSSAVGQLAVSVSQVAGSARDASARSLEADRKAKDGAIAVERLVRSTREVADDISAVVHKMNELGSASERIGAIIEVIDAISDQTNLLALNAAIEAARAGDHGRGFAVVADEVRKLAESSAQSTREIGSLIKDIQAKTAEVVTSTSESGKKAEGGLAMADIAGRAITDISKSVSDANALIEQISMAAREQASGADAIVDSVERMNGLMREAATSLDEQNTSNRQIMQIVAAIQRDAAAVEGAIARQRTSCDRMLSASKSVDTARHAANDALAALEGEHLTFRTRLQAAAGKRDVLSLN